MKWFDVEKNLPQVNFTQLLFLECGSVSTGYLSRRRPEIIWEIHDERVRKSKVTHWMPVPEDP